MMLDYTVIGKRIRDLRRLKHLTQEQLAEKVDVSPLFIRHIEKAKRTARLETYVRIVNVLECSMDELLQGYQTFDGQSRRFQNFYDLLKDCSEAEIARIEETVAQLKQEMRS